MEQFFNHTKKIIFHKQKDILSSALILSLTIIISRIFGIIRYRTLANYFSNEELDIFFASFRIPDFVFEIIITGALSSAFIPLFIKYKNDQKKLSENISSIINFIIIGLFIFIIVVFFTTDLIASFIMPGFSPQNLKLSISISKVLLISQLPFLVMGNVLSGISQAPRIFIITSIAPILYNLGIIIGTILFAKNLWIYGPLVGVILGSTLFFLIQLPILLTVRFNYQLVSLKKKSIIEFIRLFLPRVMSVLTTQLDLTIDLTLATLLGPGKYTIFFFSQHLQLFPVSFLGMSFGQASLPYLSELYNNKKIEELKKIFTDSILQLLYLSIPISFLFIFTRTPIVRLLFGGNRFDWEGTVLTAKTLSYFAVSLPFHTIFYFITRVFYATHNTKTPFFVNFFSVFINTILSIIFIIILKLPVWSLALSFSISIIINIFILLYCFYKQVGKFGLTRLINNSIKIYLASFIAAFISYIMMKFMDQLVFDTTRTINVFLLLLTISIIFGIIYLFLSWLFNIEEIYVLGKLLIKIKEIRKKIIEVYTDVS